MAHHLKEGWGACSDKSLPQKMLLLSVLIDPQQTYMHRILDKTSTDAQETQYVRAALSVSSSSSATGIADILASPHLQSMVNGELDDEFLKSESHLLSSPGVDQWSTLPPGSITRGASLSAFKVIAVSGAVVVEDILSMVLAHPMGTYWLAFESIQNGDHAYMGKQLKA
eukprot:3463693-Pyramimonas_sp.AAC.1